MQADEAQRRIYAARIIRGMSQKQMDAAGVGLGLGRQELSRTERGEIPFTKARAMVFCEVLRVPPRWFDEDNVDIVVGLVEEQARATVADPVILSAALEQLATLTDRVRAQDGQGSRTARPDKDRPGPGGRSGPA